MSDLSTTRRDASIAEVHERDWHAAGRPSLWAELERSLAVVLRGALAPTQCARWTQAVYDARAQWIEDFGGEQFALGRAFYTHVESGRASEYFADARASDERVERAVPGMAAWMRSMFAAMVGGGARARQGFCGPAVHVFPAGEKVAREGGVVHFDVEGLTSHHIARRTRTATLVVMLQPPEARGGLLLWNKRFPEDDPGDEAPVVLRYQTGDAVLMDSYRLHQIEPFEGALDRVSITLHGYEVDRGRWEVWF